MLKKDNKDNKIIIKNIDELIEEENWIDYPGFKIQDLTL
jgi:hypothetical protein